MELELHRAAAWWAGEGSVSYKNRKLSVSFAQKELCVCEWFLEIFGGHVFTRAKTDRHNEISFWSASGDRARSFISLIVDLIPESPRRQKMLRLALEETSGKLKTGPKPTSVCLRGHTKEAGRCKECSKIWRETRMNKPGAKEKHKKAERERYQTNPETRARALARSKARNLLKKGD